MVVYSDISRSSGVMASLNAALCGGNAVLSSITFGGLAARDLAELMTRWRERALSLPSSQSSS